nr:hypothetical protein [Bradyrhizobium canariense]
MLAAIKSGDRAGFAGNIHDDAFRGIGAQRFQLSARGIQRTLRQIGDDELPAIAEQGLCNRKPNAGGAAGNDCNAAIVRDALPLIVNAPVFAAGLDVCADSLA